jgi:hypothetical protein
MGPDAERHIVAVTQGGLTSSSWQAVHAAAMLEARKEEELVPPTEFESVLPA